MAAKLLHSLTDDNPDLQKQIGCMAGLFQLFDRQHMLTGSRRGVGRSPGRPPPGSSYQNTGASERESNGTHLKTASLEKYGHKNSQDRQRVSTESSRASFSSSSRSSSFSSPECNRATQSEQTSFDKMIFSDTPLRDATHSGRQAIDLRDFVKDSMYREIQGLSTRAKSTEESPAQIKHRDLPKVESKNGVDPHGSSLDQRERTPSDLKESLKLLAELQEASEFRNEPRQLSRSSSYHFKDAPRFSYDGRDSGDVFKSSAKLRDLPRLSLDSREGAARKLTVDMKSNILLKNMVKDNLARPPGVVAKLMGLEMLPDSIPSCGTEESVNISNPSDKIEQNKQPTQPSSPRYGSMKPMSRCPIEPAPWKQSESRGTQKLRSGRGLGKIPTAAFPSVYSEIEKRLKDLEFHQSGKDLRALKQILEAMESKGLLDKPKEVQDSNFDSHEDESVERPETGRVLSSTAKVSSGQSHESPIVIMKPVKLVQKSGLPDASGIPASKNLIAKSSECVNSSSSLSKPSDHKAAKTSHSGKEANVGPGPGRVLGSISPRMQQKKMELEKKSRPPTSPDLSRSTRLLNKQPGESNSHSPGGRRRTKPLKGDDRMGEASVGSGEVLARSKPSTMRGSKNSQVSSSNRSPSLSSSIQSPSAAAPEFTLSNLKPTLSISEEESGESGCILPEYSSPVSVLDNVPCKQDSSSPIKYSGKTLKVETSVGVSRNDNSVDNFAPISTDSAFEINRKKLRNIENLVQKLERLNSTHNEAHTDYIASLCENTNPDHRYVSEILLASGLLLRDLMDFQFHPSGHPINPNLFLVLEQTKTSNLGKEKSLPTTNKNQRKLIFDVVNEILTRRLVPAVGPNSEPWLRPVKIARKVPNAQKLLRELCLEIDGLRAKNTNCGIDGEDEGWRKILSEDVIHRSEPWMDFNGEMASAVLDVERMIFKDLVSEVVNGECGGLIGKKRRKACKK